MSSQVARTLSLVFSVLIILIFHIFFAGFLMLSSISPQTQRGSDWKGWANVDTIFSFGDSYTATGFKLNEQQPGPEDPFGNPPYDHNSPYLKWIRMCISELIILVSHKNKLEDMFQEEEEGWPPGVNSATPLPPWMTNADTANCTEYLTMTYNDSKIETYNFAVNGATVDKGLIDRGSAFSTQVGEKFLPVYEARESRWVASENGRRNRRRAGRKSGREDGPLTIGNQETSLFSIWFGINDNVFSNKSEVLFDRVFESYGRTVDQLHTAGAQNFLFLNVPPIQLGPHHDSSSSLAKSISSWNVRLAHLASGFSSARPEISVFLFDTYALFNKILTAPERFEQTRHLGNLEDQCDRYVKELASQEAYERECGVPYDQYFWRDGLHVTFPVHQVVAEGVARLLRGGA